MQQLVRRSGRQHQYISGRYLKRPAGIAAKLQAGGPGHHAKHLMRVAVIMVIAEHAAYPAVQPAVVIE
ncbi:hypothetical protein D3C80_2044560 [compost metagenome]